MAYLDRTTQKELLDLLTPLLDRPEDRPGLLTLALGMGCPVLQQIEYHGPVEPFILRLTQRLANFGELEPGTTALWALLETARERVGVDRQNRIDALRLALQTSAAETPAKRKPTVPLCKGSPFPGLRPFTDRDASIFFGRGRETNDLIERLKAGSHFTAVIGASGSGKSSLVWAGLIPRLKGGALEGSADWRWLRFTPGEIPGYPNPFAALALSFKPFLDHHGRSLSEVINNLEEDPATLDELINIALEETPPRAELMLFIDQFEELFTLVTCKQTQRAFINLLARAANTEGLRVVVTLRADFYHRCLDWEALSIMLRTGSYPLAAPGLGTLFEMITGPAERVGLTFDEGLVAQILQDTGTEPGALALMAFALHELYQTRSNEGCLTSHSYMKFGGVQGAIGKRADDVFDTLADPVQNKLSEVFRDLLEVDERGTATRRRAPLDDVTRSADAQTLVSTLTEARLLITDKSEGHAPMVEVAHEALFRSWPRLAAWIQATADDHRLRRQIKQLAEYWDSHERSDTHRWPDDRVVEVLDMCQHLRLRPEDFSPLERDFLGPLDCDQMLAQLDELATPHEQRAIIGVRLSLLGDPRPGVGLRADGLPDIVWCAVPGGEIALEVEARQQSRLARWLNPSGPATFHIEPFQIAKHPVTYSQYQAFLKAPDGFHNDVWWQGLPYRKPDKPGRQFNRRDNHPAENVAWVEAIAFCRWLSARLGYEIRLPTEWQWQQAATGGDPAYTYPWGPEWDGRFANTYESDLSRSTAVGIYPKGASPVGALDMAGNVWEWCLNEYENPNHTDLSSTANRVIRGGSWNVIQDFARAASRVRSFPDSRFNYLGFRVVCSSPIS
jgi:formylglycine-generating enzyme required for sulfatase activity